MDRKLKILSETNSFVVNKTVVNMVNKFQELNIKMERTPSSSTFEQFALRLNSSNTINLTQELLLKIQKLKLADHLSPLQKLGDTKITVRTFLSAYMIILYPNDIFAIKGTEEEMLLKSANSMIEIFEKICEDIKTNQEFNQELLGKFKIEHKKYIEIFDGWKKRDASKFISILSRSYYELEMTQKLILQQAVNEERAKRDDEEIWCTEINKQKEQIIKQLKIVGGEKAVNELDNYVPDTTAQMSMQEVYETAEKAFWDSFEQELKEKKYDRIINMLNEIIERLKSYTPRKESLRIEIEEGININNVKESLEKTKDIDKDGLKDIFTFVVNRIKMYESPAENDSTELWREGLYRRLNQDNMDYSKVLPLIFKGIFNKLDKIEKDISSFLKKIEGTSPLSSPKKN